MIPEIRIRKVNDAEAATEGKFVLYWMIANRRCAYNFSLQHAVDWAAKLKKPLLVLEALRCDYPWASDRLHRFVIEGMADNAAHFTGAPALYYPYLESRRGAGNGLLRRLANRACVVVSDDFPAFFLPRMIEAASKQINVRFEIIDSNGLLPMRAAEKVFARAFDFRRFLQKGLLPHLEDMPKRNPFARRRLPELKRVPAEITKRWPAAKLDSILESTKAIEKFPLDHSVAPVDTKGGAVAAEKTLRAFLRRKLAIYETDRNQPEKDATSGLSPYLHFGHISAHQVFKELTRKVGWTPALVSKRANGSSSGWWGSSPEVESFLDELITWRELGYNMCWQREDYHRYESLPEWSQRTLAEHAQDVRQHVYSLQQFEASETHDELWNAAQRQLVREGRIHNYLRMLWGKKILEWSPSPREALDTMIELNNRYALDGRNPNSYSGIFWVLGRYDRAWGPERPVFGKVRYMSSENTARKVRVKSYLQRYAKEDSQQRLAPG